MSGRARSHANELLGVYRAPQRCRTGWGGIVGVPIRETIAVLAGCGRARSCPAGASRKQPACQIITFGRHVAMRVLPVRNPRAPNSVVVYDDKNLSQKGFTDSSNTSVHGFRLGWFQEPSVLQSLCPQQNGRKGISLATVRSHAGPWTNF